ncbi:MAG: hypothetical protein KDD11_19300, partial [Acidobacteria bacterium]|nr:hypothetical protein [Acidobacteriota bacterium]
MHPSRLRFVAFFCLFVAAFGLGFASRFGLERWLHGPEASSEETSPQLRAAGATDGAVALRPEAAGGAAAGAAAPDPSDRPGKWRRARSAEEDVTPSAPVDPAQLTAVPYLQGYRRASGEYGVTVHDPRATPGLNLVTSGHAPEAVLMDMDGKVLHRWRSSLRRVWPDLPDRPRMQKLEYWRRALPLEDGSLLAIFEINGLVKLDRESKLLWAYRSDVHHDLFVAPDDTIWVLDRRGRLEPRLDPKEPILDDLVTVLSPDGKVLKQISILDAFERSPFAAAIQNRPVKTGDIFHTNTLERLDGSLEHLHPAFR